MLIVTSKQMTEIETKAYECGCSDDAFMVLAGANVAKIIKTKAKSKKIILICGKGNNGGDAYVAGSILLKEGFKVTAYHFTKAEETSKLNQKYFNAFQNNGGESHFLNDLSNLSFPDDAVLVDALLGTGFKGELEELYLSIIKEINSCSCQVISVDIPSGLNGTTGIVTSCAVKADITIYLGLLKIGFFLNDGPIYTGSLIYANFGLPEEYIKQARGVAYYFQKENVELPVINKKRHKYDVGYVLGVGGSNGMVGAAILSAYASLKAGSGIVRLYSIGKSLDAQSKPLEVIHQSLSEENLLDFFEELKRSRAIFIGPGMGRDQITESLFFKIIEGINDYKSSAVLDADALFFLAKNPSIKLPQDTVLTPHRGEMLKLLNEKELDDEKLIERTVDFAKQKGVIVVLKGAPTFVINHKEKIFVISSGTPALAKAGSGDVLTGVITAQIAQKISPFQAALQGAFLHGLAGEIAEKKTSTYSLMATDIIECLSDSFKSVQSFFDNHKTNR